MAITAKSADLAGFTLVEVTAENVANYRVSASNDSAGTGGIPGAPRVSLSPGDVINVRIAESKEGGLFAPLATGGTSFANVRVDYKGNISLPYAGQLKVEGLDPNAVGEQIKAKLNGVTFQPQVYVELVSDRGSSVLVAGDVKAPGRFSMMDGPMTLIDAVNRAGGPVRAPHQEDVIVRRGGKVMRVSYAKILDGRNAQLRAGDEVLLEPNLKVFNALGAVTKTGQVEFTKPNLTLLDALSQVGGLDNANSSNRGVFVFRLREPKAWLDGSNKWQQGPAIFQFDMSVPETMFLAQAFGMRPDDTIYVTNAPSVEWLRSLAPIATTLSAMKSAYSLGKTASGL
ncbi:MAG: polysaccharide biosynthesis/export family protein [Rhizobiales bacterium]|nr:polysaccharide biosynthesis/export family protein [Hyphomicrobiales bacterium]MBI3674289.1 polysaccharide biosynthesis/export family protein [Hyphomicrobiales bacterium]